jgi:hypothetical protein
VVDAERPRLGMERGAELRGPALHPVRARDHESPASNWRGTREARSYALAGGGQALAGAGDDEFTDECRDGEDEPAAGGGGVQRGEADLALASRSMAAAGLVTNSAVARSSGRAKRRSSPGCGVTARRRPGPGADEGPGVLPVQPAITGTGPPRRCLSSTPAPTPRWPG